eukprot:3973409-Amphidinium_carterae.1
MACSMTVCHRWVPSETNPADAPSRKYESSHVKKTTRQLQSTDANDSARACGGLTSSLKSYQRSIQLFTSWLVLCGRNLTTLTVQLLDD